jgi:hypothetical protein
MEMKPRLPPPDPHESLDIAPVRDASLPGPTAVFPRGAGSAERDRVADAILDLRPGLLIVCHPA